MTERKLIHGDGEAERFYGALEAPALIGIEACGSQWFIELLERLGHQVRVGEAAQSVSRLDDGFRKQYQDFRRVATASRKAWPRWRRPGS